MNTKIDETDKQLIELLQEDAYQSSEAIARKLYLSPTTVRRRIKKLLDSKILRVVALVDSEKVGLPFGLVIGLKVAGNKLQPILNNLDERKEIMWLAAVTGRFDVMAFAHFHSTDELSRFIQTNLANMDGVLVSETFVCLQMRKGRWRQI